MNKLSDFYKGQVEISMIDIIFDEMVEKGIKEVEVNREEMRAIRLYVIGNCGQTEYGAEAIKTGVVSHFMGIKLL